jgi:hypothetical protein
MHADSSGPLASLIDTFAGGVASLDLFASGRPL